jgi:hypothetical protein
MKTPTKKNGIWFGREQTYTTPEPT